MTDVISMYTQAEFDPTTSTRLPEAVRAKAAVLLDVWHAKDDLARGARRRANDAEENRRLAERRVSGYDDQIHRGAQHGRREVRIGPNAVRTEPDGRREKLAAELAEAKAVHQRLNRVAAERRAEADETKNLIRRLENFLYDLPREEEIRVFAGTAPSLPKADLANAVARMRETLAGLAEEAAMLRAAPYPKAELKKRVRAQVDALAARGAPDVARLLAEGVTYCWPVTRIVAQGVVGDGRTTQSTVQLFDALSVLAWFDADKLAARLDAVIDAQAEEGRAWGSEERAKRLAEIAAQRLEIERAEEGAIMKAAGSGIPIARRPDADLRAVFGLADDVPGAAEV